MPAFTASSFRRTVAALLMLALLVLPASCAMAAVSLMHAASVSGVASLTMGAPADTAAQDDLCADPLDCPCCGGSACQVQAALITTTDASAGVTPRRAGFNPWDAGLPAGIGGLPILPPPRS